MGMTDAIKAMMEADIDAAAVDISGVVTHAGVEVTGTVSPLSKADDISGDGLLESSDYEWVGVLSDFTAGTPAVRSVVDLDGVKCVVDSAVNDGAGLTLRLSRRDDKTSTRGII